MRPVPADFTYDQLAVGQQASFRRVITREEVDAFGRLSGDLSPLHTSDDYAASQTRYEKRLVHGMHAAALVSCLIGMHLPGFRSVCLRQSFDFVHPVYEDQEVEVAGKVLSKQDGTRTVVLGTEILVDGAVCVKGKAVVQVLDSALEPRG